MKILVKSDVFDICNRIKKFDRNYRLVLDISANRYEIYSTQLSLDVEIVSGVVLSYVCGLPYDELDERTIKYLYDTSVDNLESIVKQIDNHNQMLENRSKTTITENSIQIFENRLRQLT